MMLVSTLLCVLRVPTAAATSICGVGAWAGIVSVGRGTAELHPNVTLCSSDGAGSSLHALMFVPLTLPLFILHPAWCADAWSRVLNAC